LILDALASNQWIFIIVALMSPSLILLSKMFLDPRLGFGFEENKGVYRHRYRWVYGYEEVYK
jgi:hypothetical protein